MHNAWVVGKNGAKMSKSIGNIFTAQELVEKKIDPLAYRYLFLTTHYRKGMEFSLENLLVVAETYSKLRGIVSEWPEGGMINEDYQKVFKELISNDLAMPEVIALVWKLIKDEKLKAEDKKATLLDFDKVLGLDLDKKVKEEEIPQEIKDLAQKRVEAKANKDWAEADRLRDLIKEKGYLVEDTKDDCKIKRIMLS
jgi:cysteinyl-tRNA synthetase